MFMGKIEAAGDTRQMLAQLIASRLAEAAEAMQAQWLVPGRIRSAYVDGLLPESVAHAVRAAFPAPEGMMLKRSFRENKHVAAQMDAYDPLLEEAVYAFQDPAVMEQVARITGLGGMEPDAELYAGGISAMGQGAYLRPHLDNSHDNERRRYRVLNLLWYVSPGWDEPNGGNLQLWDKGPKGQPRTITSHFNRLVLMATDRTYRQDSRASRELLARDPDNRLLGRQGRWRIEAELVRDQALAVSGLLVADIGGPSAKPYQPPGYWENLNFPVRNYDASPGAQQYRRGLYTWWQRSYVHPSLLAFDAPTREECAAERNRSNIPQQALVLLNDPSYVEAARGFAVRILKAPTTANDAARADWAWREVLGRAASAGERETILALLEKHRAEFRSDPDAAARFLKVGAAPPPSDLDPASLAAWTDVARALLSLHETLTRS